MMMLEDWLATYGGHTINGTKRGEVAVRYHDWITNNIAWELWHLSDYVVTSVTGGVIWLVRREPD
jgi:hypothetical protein